MINDIATIPLFEEATGDELAWLVAHSRELWLERGDYFVREGQRATSCYVVLEGELQIFRTINGRETDLGTTPRGIVGNELPLLNGTPAPFTARAILPSRLMVFDLPAFRAIFANCPTVGAKILQIASQRMRSAGGMLSHQDQMAALGKLSAGLAHELNNPAAAVRRSVQLLAEQLPALQSRTLRLGTLALAPEQQALVLAFQQHVSQRATALPTLSILDQSDREEQIVAWLDARTVPDAWMLAATFAGAHLTCDDLVALAADLPGTAVIDVLLWLHASLTAASLLTGIDQGAERIAELVGAVKSYTYMDRGTRQAVDIHRGIEDTLAILSYKLRGVTVVRAYDPALPKLPGYRGDLNQVWTNLIDNAIDALQGTGSIQLITRRENNLIVVEVVDNGPGIPADILPKIFEPFFTTREVGQGTGLGLDICYQIVERHGGTINVESRPGLTRFIVQLPLEAESG